jgi:hypothetical protein
MKGRSMKFQLKQTPSMQIPIRDSARFVTMKTRVVLIYASVGLLFLLGGAQLRADITVRVSVKFILKPDGTRPAAGSIGTTAGFDAEITRGNLILAATGRGYRLQVVEYLDIRPPVPGGQPSDYWYNLDARSNRAFIEGAATGDQATWRWNANSINIYVNNSSSGQCSFVGTGGAITLGNDIGTGTVLHEVGHFFNLQHTHAGDYGDNPNTPPYAASDLRDGDGLAETANDNPNISNHDQLSQALFGHVYSAATTGEKSVVDSAYENVMSYHNENTLLSDQMDIWTSNASSARRGFCTGRTWLVDRNNGCLFHDGSMSCSFFSGAYSVVRDGVSSAQSGDIVLIRPGNYNEPMTINKAVTLRSTRGSATIGLP